MTETIEQQLAAARAEIAWLTSHLPPQPAPGQVWRPGSKCPSNLYAHADGLAPKGEPVGVMRSAELAAHVVRAVNAWEWGSEVTEGRKVLDVPMESNDSGARTIRGYLVALLEQVWTHGEGFSGKRPFGNSCWESDLYLPLAKAGLIRATFDEDGCLDDCDEVKGNRLIAAAIAELGVAR